MVRVLTVMWLSVAISAPVLAEGSVEGMLCRSQLELLMSGDKLTDEEIARFEAQCACLEVEGGVGGKGISACTEDKL